MANNMNGLLFRVTCTLKFYQDSINKLIMQSLTQSISQLVSQSDNRFISVSAKAAHSVFSPR